MAPLPGLPSPRHALVVILVLQEYRFPSWSLLSLQESHPRGAEQGVSLELHKAQSQTRVKGNSSEFHLNPIKSTAESSVTYKLLKSLTRTSQLAFTGGPGGKLKSGFLVTNSVVEFV